MLGSRSVFGSSEGCSWRASARSFLACPAFCNPADSTVSESGSDYQKFR